MNVRRKSRWLKTLLSLALLAGGVTGGAWYYQRHYPPEAPAYQTMAVSKGVLLQVVTASGQLNPVTMVDVGSQISGIIEELLADYNSGVKKGELIARIDAATYEANFIQAEGNLANAKAALELAKLGEQRAKALRASKLNPEADYDKAFAELHQAEANAKIQEGVLKKAQVDLARCSIYAPIDGIVLSRNVNVGQTVAASLSAPTLFVIANDLTKMQIEANVAEADIGLVAIGQDATFVVDAFTGQNFQGKVKQIRNAPRTEQNVVTYATIVEVSNPDLKLKPGMTANVSIIVARRDDALKVPNAALRFRPPGGAERRTAVLSPGTETSAKSGKEASTGHRKKDKRKSERVVYVVTAITGRTNAPTDGGKGIDLQPVQIKTGINDPTYSEVLDGLKEGDEVATGVVAAKGRSGPVFNPFGASSKRR